MNVFSLHPPAGFVAPRKPRNRTTWWLNRTGPISVGRVTFTGGNWHWHIDATTWTVEFVETDPGHWELTGDGFKEPLWVTDPGDALSVLHARGLLPDNDPRSAA